jgi:hypothetical protein
MNVTTPLACSGHVDPAQCWFCVEESVDSDFYLIKWEKNEFRSALTDSSFEGILHYMQ